jgi:hypothetical protein
VEFEEKLEILGCGFLGMMLWVLALWGVDEYSCVEWRGSLLVLGDVPL